MDQSWDDYAVAWTQRKKEKTLHIEDPLLPSQSVKTLGEEWGNVASVNEVIEDFIVPYLDEKASVLELGSGGGRISQKVAPLCQTLYCADISPEMLKKAKEACATHQNVFFVQIEENNLKKVFTVHKFDFIYVFDVFVHLELADIFRYMQQMMSLLRENGKLFIHTANIETLGGFRYFLNQVNESHENAFGALKFSSPETLLSLANRLHLNLIKRNFVSDSNFYYSRDNLMVFEKVSA